MNTEYDKLLEWERDTEQEVHELSEELHGLEENSDEWETVLMELQEKENQLQYIHHCLEDYND